MDWVITGYYFSSDGEEGILIETNRDQKYIIKLIEKEQVDNLVPPKLGDKDFQVMDNNLKAIQDEMKDFHGRLSVFEYRYPRLGEKE